MNFFLIFFIGLSTYKNEYGSRVAALNCALSTPNSDDILLDYREEGNS